MSAQHFLSHLHEVLRAHPDGLSEYELIKQLEADGVGGFDTSHLKNSLPLFQTHFLLFHNLYKLSEQLCHSGAGRLGISPLCIQLLPLSQSGSSHLAEADPLREYYLDISNMQNTTEHDVDTLLDQFWQAFLGDDARAEALDTLGLSDPIDWPEIKARHRQLAMQHHPDRGGDESRLQTINAAMQILAKSYGK